MAPAALICSSHHDGMLFVQAKFDVQKASPLFLQDSEVRTDWRITDTS